jgi:hypothetical protein
MICMIKEAIVLHPRHADALHTVVIFKAVQVCIHARVCDSFVCIRVCIQIHIYDMYDEECCSSMHTYI